MNKISSECFAELGSMTLAMKAHTALVAAAIPSEVIKMQSSSRRGCVYGLSFSCHQQSNARLVLSNARIPVKSFGGGENL